MKSKTHNNEPFRGKLVKMQLRSTCMGYGPRPEPDEEVEQLLIIDAKGRTIHFEHLNYGDGNFVCVREETNHGSESQISPFGCLNNFYFRILSNFLGSLQLLCS